MYDDRTGEPWKAKGQTKWKNRMKEPVFAYTCVNNNKFSSRPPALPHPRWQQQRIVEFSLRLNNCSLFGVFTEGLSVIIHCLRSKNTPALQTRSLMKAITDKIFTLKQQQWLWVSISIDWSIKSLTCKFKVSIVIDLQNRFPISVCIDWTRQVQTVYVCNRKYNLYETEFCL